jgi:sec-independent protein translocase protein TatA
MFNLGPFELVAIFVVALLVFGPDKLPEMGRQAGKAFREFKKFQASMESNVRDVIDPITGPIVNNGPVGPPPTNVRDGGTVAHGDATANVPRSATIQDPEPADEGKEAAAPGSFGYYAPTEPPAAPENGPAPAGEPAPPEPPADADPR